MIDGIFTLENISTGEYRTFKIQTQEADAKFAPGQRIIYLLSGPANQHDYQGFGFVRDLPGFYPDVNVWKSKKGEIGSKSEFEKLAGLLGGYWHGRLADRYRRIDPVPCKRCGELLTVPKSVERGLGPYCARQ